MTQPTNSGGFNIEAIGQMLASFKDKATDPKTLASIQAGFGPALAQVKDKLGHSWQDIQTIYQMAFDSSFDMKSETKIACIAALAYLVSPIDLLPERFLGPLGLADDVAVLMFVLNFSKPEIVRYTAFKENLAAKASTPGGSSNAS